MRRHLRGLAILALPLIIVLVVGIAILDEGKAQTSCCFQNTCEVFQDAGPDDKLCSTLRCNRSSNSCQTWFGRHGCEHIPATCGPGSHLDRRIACDPDLKKASWSYVCVGGGVEGSASPASTSATSRRSAWTRTATASSTGRRWTRRRARR